MTTYTSPLDGSDGLVELSIAIASGASKLILAVPSDSGLTPAFADLVFLFAVLHAPAPDGDEFALRAETRNPVIRAIDHIHIPRSLR